MNTIQNPGFTYNSINNNINKNPQVAFKAQFNVADLKLLAKDITPAEEHVGLTFSMVYTMAEYLKDLPGKCATFVKGEIISPTMYFYELHIDGKKATDGITYRDNPGEACRNALAGYTVNGATYKNLKHRRMGWDEVHDMCRDNWNKNINDLSELAIIE